MNPAALINAGLAALNAVLGVIAEIRGQSGVTDDAILAAAQATVSQNDAFYTTLVNSLIAPVPASPATPAVKKA
jgi:hypothetical protein